jgi:hypothetical protein
VSFKQEFILTTAVSLIPITMNIRTLLFLFYFTLTVGLYIITGKEIALALGESSLSTLFWTHFEYIIAAWRNL